MPCLHLPPRAAHFHALNLAVMHRCAMTRVRNPDQARIVRNLFREQLTKARAIRRSFVALPV